MRVTLVKDKFAGLAGYPPPGRVGCRNGGRIGRGRSSCHRSIQDRPVVVAGVGAVGWCGLAAYAATERFGGTAPRWDHPAKSLGDPPDSDGAHRRGLHVLVEAAGIKPIRTVSPNPLMALDFCSYWLPDKGCQHRCDASVSVPSIRPGPLANPDHMGRLLPWLPPRESNTSASRSCDMICSTRYRFLGI